MPSPTPLPQRLERAVLSGDLSSVENLLETHTADASLPPVTPQDLASPLNTAVTHGHVAIVRLLLDHGAPITVSTNALVGAVDQPRPQDMFEAFLDHGWSVDSTANKNGPMVMCLAMNHPDGETLLTWFLSHGAPAAGLPSDPGAPLRRARTPGMIRSLLAHGASLAHTSALHTAIERYDDQSTSLPLVDTLLDHGAEIDELQYAGWTCLPRGAGAEDHGAPLHIAAREGALEVVKTLVRRGADVATRSKNGYTARDWAQLFKKEDVKGYLEGIMRERGVESRELEEEEDEDEDERAR